MLIFFVYPDPKVSEEPTIPRKSGEELGEAKINLQPSTQHGVNKLIFNRLRLSH